MDRDTIIQKFNSCESLLLRIRATRKKGAKKAILKSVCLLCIAVLLSVAFDFSPLRWMALCLSALALSLVLFKPHSFLMKCDPTVGMILEIRHEYQTGAKKGTGGWNSPHVYTSIEQTHSTVLVLTGADEAHPTVEVLCPPEHERLFRVGDVVLAHPALAYPSNLSNRISCLCAHCATEQSADNITCYNCHGYLCNHTTMV